MLRSLLGFSAKKKEVYVGRIRHILVNELGIDVDNSTNPNFLPFLGYIEIIDRFFYKKRTPEHCALFLAGDYWERLLLTENKKDFEEAVQLKPKFVCAINKYSDAGMLFPELTARFYNIVSVVSDKYSI
jgi:hypothetical protein